MNLISIIIPVYRGERTIELLLSKIKEVFETNNTFCYEVIFVYDCGNDNSWQVIERLVNKNNNIVKGIRLSRNFGQHNALICGFAHAKGKFIVTMDEDLQQDPNDIFNLIEKQKESDYDVVYGKFKELKHSKFRNITSNILKTLLKKSIPELHPDYSAFRLIKSNIAQELPNMKNSYSFLDGYITWITQNVSSTTVKHSKRETGQSSYTIKKLIEHSINIFITFSNIPIRLLTFTSILTFLGTITYSAVTAFRYFIGKISVPGYSSLIITIGLGIGFILFGLGIIGEYIYRINLKTTKRPNSFISKLI